MAYFSTPDVAAFLGRSLTTIETAKLSLIIPGLCTAIETFCYRSWLSGSDQPITELFTGPKTIVYPKNTPVTSIISLKVNGILSTEYLIRKNWIELSLGDADEAEVVYVSDAIFPPDLKLALVQWAANLLADSSSQTGRAVKRVQVGAVSVEYMAGSELPEFVTTIAKKYLRLAV